jgi:hypothetical protein
MRYEKENTNKSTSSSSPRVPSSSEQGEADRFVITSPRDALRRIIKYARVLIVIITRIGPRVFSPIYKKVSKRRRRRRSEENSKDAKKRRFLWKNGIFSLFQSLTLSLSWKKKERREKTILHNSTHKRAPFFLFYALPRPRKEGARAREREGESVRVFLSQRVRVLCAFERKKKKWK